MTSFYFSSFELDFSIFVPLEKIGFREQPYLTYQHFDAGHPHIHIVSVKVREDGSRVDTQNTGRNQSD